MPSPARRDAPEPAAWLPIPNVDTLDVPVVAGPLNGGNGVVPTGISSAPNDIDLTAWESPARQVAPEPAVWFRIPNIDTLEIPVVATGAMEPPLPLDLSGLNDVVLVPARTTPHHRPTNRPVSPAIRRTPVLRRPRRTVRPETQPVVPTIDAPLAAEARAAEAVAAVTEAPVLRAPVEVPLLPPLSMPSVEELVPAVVAPPVIDDAAIELEAPLVLSRVDALRARRDARLAKRRRQRVTTYFVIVGLAVAGVAYMGFGGTSAPVQQRVRAIAAPTQKPKTTGTIAPKAQPATTPTASTPTAAATVPAVPLTYAKASGTQVVPFKIITTYVSSLPKGEKRVLQSGRNGLLGIQYSVGSNNGVPVSKTQIGSWIAIPVQNEIIEVGTSTYVAPPASPGSGSVGSTPAPPTPTHQESGTSTFYTGSGTGPGYCAFRDAPRGTRLTVTNAATGATTYCIVNDYGPKAWTGHILDLNPANFSQIAPIGQGVASVIVTWP
jgi:hypothetical protein